MKKVKKMTYDEVNRLMDDSKRNVKDMNSCTLLGNLITPDVCIWWIDNGNRGVFRALDITSVAIMNRNDGVGELCINFDVIVHTKKGGIKKVPHFGFWTLRRNGGFIEPWVEFGDNDEYLIIPGSLEINNN